MSEQPGPSGGRATSDDLVLASLVVGGLALTIGLMNIFGARGIALSLGAVALTLALMSLRRAGAEAGATGKSSRGMSVSALLLASSAVAVGVFVVTRGS